MVFVEDGPGFFSNPCQCRLRHINLWMEVVDGGLRGRRARFFLQILLSQDHCTSIHGWKNSWTNDNIDSENMLSFDRGLYLIDKIKTLFSPGDISTENLAEKLQHNAKM